MLETYHVAHLVRDILQPSLKGLYLGNHLGKLPADDSLREERLAEDVTLRRPLEALLDNSSGASDRGAAHHPAEASVKGMREYSREAYRSCCTVSLYHA